MFIYRWLHPPRGGLKARPPLRGSAVTKRDEEKMKRQGYTTKRKENLKMEFFMNLNPPTVTAQEHKVTMIGGRPHFYDPAPVKAAKKKLTAHLLAHKPKEPYIGAVALSVVWLFPKGKRHKNGEWRKTKPDIDNLQKMLKDCMTKCGFWKDDALVVRETVEKRWSDDPTGIYIEITDLEV